MPPKRVSVSDTIAAASQARGESTEQQEQIVLDLPLDQIMPNLAQPRKTFDEAALDELAASIRERGLISPIIVRPIKSIMRWEGYVRRYEIIAGERRWRASGRAGMATIKAILRDDVRDDDARELALIENVQREDLNPLEEGQALLLLHVDLGYSYGDIAKKIGKTKSYVQRRIEVTNLPPDLQELVRDKPDAMTTAAILAQLPEEDQRAPLIQAVRDGSMFKREVQLRVDEILNPDAAPEPGEREEPEERPSSADTSPGGDTGEARPFDATKRMKQANRAIEEILANIDFLPPEAQAQILSASGEMVGNLEQIMTKLAALTQGGEQ